VSQSRLTDHEKDSTHPESDHHGASAYIRSDNGPGCVVNTVRSHLSDLDVVTRFIAPDAHWENGYIESFNGTFRNELLNREVFGHLLEAKVLGEKYRQEYNRTSTQLTRLPDAVGTCSHASGESRPHPGTSLPFTLVQKSGHPTSGALVRCSDSG